jgi:hypothetical protein
MARVSASSGLALFSFALLFECSFGCNPFRYYYRATKDPADPEIYQGFEAMLWEAKGPQAANEGPAAPPPPGGRESKPVYLGAAF